MMEEVVVRHHNNGNTKVLPRDFCAHGSEGGAVRERLKAGGLNNHAVHKWIGKWHANLDNISAAVNSGVHMGLPIGRHASHEIGNQRLASL